MRSCHLLFYALVLHVLQTFIHECGAGSSPSGAVTGWTEGERGITGKRRGSMRVHGKGELLVGRFRIRQNGGHRGHGEVYEERQAGEQAALNSDINSIVKESERSSSRVSHFIPNEEIVFPKRSPTIWHLERQEAYRRIRREPRPEENVGQSEPEPSAESSATPSAESNPKPESTSEPEPSPESESTSEPELTPKPESTSQPKSTAEPEGGWPEPAPKWPNAYEKWQAAWPLHRYGFATVFSLIAVVQVIELFRIYAMNGRKTPLKLSLMTMIFIFSTTRAIVLFVNPYGSTQSLPPMATRLLSSIAHPCIIAAVSLLLLVLIDTTKMNVAPPKFQSLAFIVPVITVHVLLVVVSDVIVTYFLQAKFLLLFCQLYFFVTGLAFTLGYACVGWKISKNVASNVHRGRDRSQDSKMKKLQRLIFAFTVTSAMLLAVTIYGAAGIFGVYSDVKYVEAWSWWSLHTAFRCLETAMCVLLIIMNINTTGSSAPRWFRIFSSNCCFGRTQVQPWHHESTIENGTWQNTTSVVETTTERAPKR